MPTIKQEKVTDYGVVSAQEHPRLVAFLHTMLSNRPDRLALAEDWLQSSLDAGSGYRFFNHSAQDGFCVGAAPARWVAGAEGVLEVQDFIASSAQPALVRENLLSQILEHARSRQARMVVTQLCSADQDDLLLFLTQQGWSTMGTLLHYYRPEHHQVILVKRL